MISALADGEADAAECGRGCAAWADADAGSVARRSWHAYHLIGDVLRSDDLAAHPARDAGLPGAAARAPGRRACGAGAAAAGCPASQVGARAPRRTAWVMPAALAAGCDGAGDGAGGHAGPGGRCRLVRRRCWPPRPAACRGARQARLRRRPCSKHRPQGSRIVRDAQLDRYLRAHRDYGTALPGSLPGGPARSIATVSLER